MAINSINCDILKSWLKNDQVLLIDVREPSENQAARIKEAKLIPLGEIDIDKIPNLNGKKLVIHCKSGKRSFFACQKLTAQNPDLDAYNLEGGIEAWVQSGGEIDC